MNHHDITAQELSKFCDLHNIPEMVCMFQTADEKTITIHIARDGLPSPAYEALKTVVDKVMQATQEIIETRKQ